MSLTISQRNTSQVEILTLSGRLTLGEASSALRSAVRAAIDRDRHLLVDLSAVSYIDSSGLGELVAGFASVSSRGRVMKLLKPHQRVDSMLQITKLYTTFEIFEDEPSALASFGSEK
jgi:anti-sigma B factor antagonist